eukprot:7383662-Prymnesium_polylepis.2
MQDLKTDGVHVGLPPGRKITLSHGWSAEMHPCPNGEKMKRLAQKLEKLGYDKERDGVFLDYCSLPQKAFPNMPKEYFDNTNTKSPMQDRTPMERVQFNFAMHEMCAAGAIWPAVCPGTAAVGQCIVIVDPHIDAIDKADTRWGNINHRKYENRGWCCAEFSVAYKNNRIINKDDPAVQEVIKSRKWPKDIHEYAAMMTDDALPKVEFTDKGDRSTVLYNFYKMTTRIEPYRFKTRRSSGAEWAKGAGAKQGPPSSPRRASSVGSPRLGNGMSFESYSSSDSLYTGVI